MKHDYSIIVFTEDAEQNKAMMQNRDYHTLCVIQDATGYSITERSAGDVAAHWVKHDKSFPINPAWPCCKGRAWYAEQGAKLAETLNA